MGPKVGYTAAGIPVNTATEPSAWEEMSGAGAWTNENLGPRPGDRMLELTLAIEPVLSCFLLRYIPVFPQGRRPHLAFVVVIEAVPQVKTSFFYSQV